MTPALRRSRTIATAATAIALTLTACDDRAATDTASTSPPTSASETSARAEAPPPTVAPPAASPVTRPPAGAAAAAGTLTADEIAGLVWMREEEQLARDVYVALGNQYDVRVFDKISAAEAKHVGEVMTVLDHFGIADPAAANEPGVFTNPTIQDLYDDLVDTGSQSLEAALQVGARIEQLDIADLQQRASGTDDAVILALYERLEHASNRHLEAFGRQLESRGLAVEPI